MRYGAAAVQFEPRFGEKAWNLERLEALVREAATAGARLVVLPEMATTGYCFRSRDEIAGLVEAVPGGPTCAIFERLARQLGVHIVADLPEVEPATGAYYNTAALIGPAGFIGKYRKTHAFIDETRWARDGDLGIPVFATELGRIALCICMDFDYFETARVAALAGADVIAFPNNWLSSPHIWFTRALENGVYVVGANRWGEERGARFCGHSCVIDPGGMALNLLTTGDGITLAEVDLDLATARRAQALARRRPEQYQELLINRYLWSWREAQLVPPGRPAVVAVGQAVSLAGMADQARWADRVAREQGYPRLDLIVFPPAAGAEGELAAVAGDLDCHIVWGSAEGTASLVGPGGLEGRYRSRSGEFPVFDLPWGRVGLLAGDDLWVPEVARILAKQGADLLAAPVRWEGDYDRLLWKSRWIENETPVAVANSLSGSHIYHPKGFPRLGRAEAGAGEGGMAISVIDTASDLVRSKELLRKLQHQWYGSLVIPQ